MAGNSFGELFKITSFGESHGPALGVVVDGCPAGLTIDLDFIQAELNKRRPGQSKLSTARSEGDQLEILSGVFEQKTLGTPICMLVRNADQRSADYDNLKDIFRPSHADYTYQAKYGHRDHRGGGRQSARETISRVMAGALAKLILREYGIQVQAFVHSVSELELALADENIHPELAWHFESRCPDAEMDAQIRTRILQAKAEKDSLGGVIRCFCTGVPVGLGEPVFDKLHADLGKAMLSINAVKGIEFGSGFSGTHLRGSENNDEFLSENGKIRTASNRSGGIQGGISNGERIDFKVAFKPVASIGKPQKSMNTSGEEVMLEINGRHDPCVLPRAVVIVEAMAALVLADHLLRNRSSRMQPLYPESPLTS
ncbi:MAG: chorismate synthase [Bacteroidia bacterium]|nr:chorismate synthase [Bacteroidia bacterium]